MPVSELHRQVAMVALRAAAPHGFALGGGNALIAHGIIERPTQDLDLVTEEVLLLVSELAGNAVKHSASGDGGEFGVAISVTGGHVRIEVGDQGGASGPKLSSEEGLATAIPTGGRGLQIVDALAARWGHAGGELGRVVWFEVPAGAHLRRLPNWAFQLGQSQR